MTPQEVKLWVHLRSWRQRGFHFRRQSRRDGYIVDFACMKHRLVIEVDYKRRCTEIPASEYAAFRTAVQRGVQRFQDSIAFTKAATR